MNYQVLARKWRPHHFGEIVGQEPILRMLINALNHQRLHHAYLLTGTRGVGKTTLARILAKCLNCETGITSTPCENCNICRSVDAGNFLDLIEIDAASRTKVEDTREILDNVQYSPTQGRFKIYLIDEVHMLSGHSFNALLKTLEEPPSHVKFLLATTDPKRLPITILSRCLQFNLKRVPQAQIAQHLKHICDTENVPAEIPALNIIAKAAEGSIRDALSLLDQAIAYCGEKITTSDTQQMLGNIEETIIFGLINALAEQDGKKLLSEIYSLIDNAPDFSRVLEEMLSILHQISVAQTITSAQNTSEDIAALAKKLTPEDTQLYYQIALLGRKDLAISPNLQQTFEMTLLRMLAFKPVLPDDNTPQKIIKQEILATQVPKADSPSPVSVNSSNDTPWEMMLPRLGLSGLALALASNCTLRMMSDDKIELALAPQHTAMLNDKLTTRIEQALITHLNHPIKLSIKIAESDLQNTPAQQAQQQKAEKKTAATQAIKNDPGIQQIVDMFDATLDINSITSSG